MDCKEIKNTITVCKTILDAFLEEKVEFDVIIPDYCAAVGKILKCDIEPSVISKRVEDDMLYIECEAHLKVVYSDEACGTLKSLHQTSTFIHKHKLSAVAENYRIKIKTRASNTICRLQNSRRISVKSLVGVAAKVSGNESATLISGFDDCNIEAMFDSKEICSFIGSGQTDFHINSEIKADKPVLDIIKSHAVIYVSENKIINNKVIVKGIADVCVLYTYGEFISDLTTVNAQIPFSEIVEIEGAQEDSISSIEAMICSISCDTNNANEQDIINIEIDASVCASVYKNKCYDILSDAYSKTNKLDIKKSEIGFESLEKMIAFCEKAKGDIEIEMTDAVIDNIISKSEIKNITVADGKIILQGETLFTVFCHNQTECKVIEKSIPFNVFKDFSSEYENLRCEANILCSKIDYSMPDMSTINLSFELIFDILVFSKQSLNVISELEIIGEHDNSFNSKIIVYYADKGENLWEIAKKYCTSVGVLKRDNDIDGNELKENCVLVISPK